MQVSEWISITDWHIFNNNSFQKISDHTLSQFADVLQTLLALIQYKQILRKQKFQNFSNNPVRLKRGTAVYIKGFLIQLSKHK